MAVEGMLDIPINYSKVLKFKSYAQEGVALTVRLSEQ